VSWEQWFEVAVHNGGFWLAHLNYVAFWVLLALSAGLLSARMALQHVVLRRNGLRPVVAGRWPAAAIAAALLPVSVGTGYMAVRPDPGFFGTIADKAFEAGDCRKAVEYYAPLADWGSRDLDVYARLAACHLQLGRGDRALKAIATARRLPGGDRPDLRVWSARALEAAGRWDEAARELEAVVAGLPAGPERDALSLERARVLEAAKGGR
jgi:hypothetical protein